MKKFLCWALCAVMVFGMFTFTALADDETSFAEFTYENAEKYGTTTMPYRLYVPADYDETKAYPLLVFMHGAGERGSDNTHLTQKTPFGKLLSTENLENYPCIIVAPQCPTGLKWVDTDWGLGSYSIDDILPTMPMRMALDIIDSVRKDYNIDANRNYIMGLSMGGYATWNIIERFPDTFAAAIPICGSADPSKAALIKDMPIWTFHGDADPTVPVEGSREMVQALEDAGSTKIKYTEYPGAGHDVWTTAYSEPELFGWLFSQTKASKSENELYLAEHFTDDTTQLAARGWTFNGDKNAAFKSENGILNITSNGGTVGESVYERFNNYLPSDTIGATKDDTASNGWSFTDEDNGVSVADGVMTFNPQNAVLAQAVKTFDADTQTMVAEFSARLRYDEGVTAPMCGIQIFNGANRLFLQLAPLSIKVQEVVAGANVMVGYGDFSHANDVWYDYRAEISAGHASVMRKKSGSDNWEVLSENLLIPTNSAKPNFKAYMEKVGFATDIRDVQVNNYTTHPSKQLVTYEKEDKICDSFSAASLEETGWTASSEYVALDSTNKRLSIKSNGTTDLQNAKKDISDFKKMTFEMSYCANTGGTAATKLFSFAILNPSNRAVVTVYPSKITARVDDVAVWYTLNNVTTECGANKWYDVKVDMELFNPATNDYRYSMYRKESGSDDYQCIFSNLPMPLFVTKTPYMNLYVEGNATADVLFDDVNLTPYKYVGEAVDAQTATYRASMDGTYAGVASVKLNDAGGAEVSLNNGGCSAIMKVYEDKITIENNDGISEFETTNTIGEWNTYMIAVKDFKNISVYKKNGAVFEKIADNLTAKALTALSGISVGVSSSGVQNADFKDIRLFKGTVLDIILHDDSTLNADILTADTTPLAVDIYFAQYTSDGTLYGVGSAATTLTPYSIKTAILEGEDLTDGSCKMFIWEKDVMKNVIK